MTEIVLEDWVRERGGKTRWFLASSRRGDFPPVVRVSQRIHLVDSDAIARWRERNTVGASVGGIAAALDARPLEPFADRPAEEAGAAPAKKPARRRRAANAGVTVSRRAARRKAAK